MTRLGLIVGPPNSGKTGEVLSRLRAALPRDPLLVVPTLDDADRFERELCGDDGEAVLGASIATFDRLFEEVARAAGVVLPAAATATQALHMARRAAARSDLRALGPSARRPGFAPSLAALVDELQSAGIDPATLAADAAEAGAERGYLAELATLFAACLEIRDGIGLGDSHLQAAGATAALRSAPDAWAARPVFFYGFDDLTGEQLELVDALADAAEVTFAIAWEDRRAHAARAALLERLKELGGTVVATLEPNPDNTASPTLFHLERSFLCDGAPRVVPDDGLALLEAAGERGQAEQIGAEVARLLAGGVPAARIAIALRSPDRHGPLLASVLEGFGIPVAVEGRVRLTQTASGRGLLALARTALARGGSEDLLAFVRTPGVARLADADWLERSIRRCRLRTASEAREVWRGRELFELDELAEQRDPQVLLQTLARLARRIAERPGLREAPLATAERRLELRAGAAAAEAIEELAGVLGDEDPVAAALATLESLEVPLWRGSTEGHVRVVSPYRVRARRVDYLFVASLQEGEFPRHHAGEPFLSDEQRAALRLPERAEPEAEERYLFHVCLSRPARRLYLCWRSCDDEGAETAPSPFLDDVRDLLSPPPGDGTDSLEPLVHRRRLGDVVLPIAQAPSRDELARSLAAANAGAAPPAVAGLDAADAEALSARLAAAGAARRRRAPGPLTVAAVLEGLGGREQLGASTLEEYALCSYRWFVGHELRPEQLEPQPDARAQGSVVHAALEQLYREPPTPEGLPRPETLPAWRRRAAELVAAQAREQGLDGADARSVTARARMVALVSGLLEREAALPARLRPDRELLEASFGEGEEDARGPLDLGDMRLHGQIDRVDVPAEGGSWGLIRDYKAARRVTIGANLAKEGKLQLQLYALALERLWRRRPLGSVYQPLAATSDHAPRGLALRDEADGLLAGLGLERDMVEAEDMRETLDAAVEGAREIASRMRRGLITRDPLDDRCPSYCTYQTICRRERAARLEPEALVDEEDEE